MEYLAWGILAVFYIFGVTPMVGGLFGDNDGYKSDFIVGGFIHISLLALGGCMFALLWALHYVTAQSH
ncbi:hypothetical protein N9878_01710 [bacterium]|nr:hypothetical protein [bacterium]